MYVEIHMCMCVYVQKCVYVILIRDSLIGLMNNSESPFHKRHI